MKKLIDNLCESNPIVKIEYDENPFTGNDIKLIRVSWGDTSYGISSRDNLENVDVWIHEFTEDNINYILQRDFDIDTGTIAQILGTCPGLEFEYKGIELFATMHHLISGLVSSSYVITANDEFKLISEDEFWDMIKS